MQPDSAAIACASWGRGPVRFGVRKTASWTLTFAGIVVAACVPVRPPDVRAPEQVAPYAVRYDEVDRVAEAKRILEATGSTSAPRGEGSEAAEPREAPAEVPAETPRRDDVARPRAGEAPSGQPRVDPVRVPVDAGAAKVYRIGPLPEPGFVRPGSVRSTGRLRLRKDAMVRGTESVDAWQERVGLAAVHPGASIESQGNDRSVAPRRLLSTFEGSEADVWSIETRGGGAQVEVQPREPSPEAGGAMGSVRGGGILPMVLDLSAWSSSDPMRRVEVSYACVRDRILYLALEGELPADESGTIAAIDLVDATVRFRSAPRVQTAANFAVNDEILVSAYGSAIEPDYLYVLSARDGTTQTRTRVHAPPSHVVLQGREVYAFVPGRSYVFTVLGLRAPDTGVETVVRPRPTAEGPSTPASMASPVRARAAAKALEAPPEANPCAPFGVARKDPQTGRITCVPATSP